MSEPWIRVFPIIPSSASTSSHSKDEIRYRLYYIILTASVYGLATGPNAREYADIEGRAGPAQACGDPHHAVPLLRAYSPAQIDHFYTTNAAEFQNAVTNLGYSDEGTTGYVFSDQELYSIPLYRLYNGKIGDHFYTTNAAE